MPTVDAAGPPIQDEGAGEMKDLKISIAVAILGILVGGMTAMLTEPPKAEAKAAAEAQRTF